MRYNNVKFTAIAHITHKVETGNRPSCTIRPVQLMMIGEKGCI